MLFAKKIKQILLLVFLVSTLASCDRVCYEADQFYAKLKSISANGRDDELDNSRPARTKYGNYNDINGGEVIEWQKTGLIASGDDFLIAISGGWIEVGGNSVDSAKEISAMRSCRICFRSTFGENNTNCICGPILDNGTFEDAGKVMWESPRPEATKEDGELNDNPRAIDCSLESNYNDINKCTCKIPNADQKSKFFKDNEDDDYFSFSRDAYRKMSTQRGQVLEPLDKDRRRECAYKMGVGLYIGLVPPGDSVPPVAYHLASQEVICPIGFGYKRQADGTLKKSCLDKNGIDRSKFIYRSPNLKIFKKIPPGSPASNSPGSEYHQRGDEVRLNIYDQFLSDNNGKYSVEFMKGVISNDHDGLIAGIVRTFDRYLFGDKNQQGVVEFMYRAILKDKIVRNVISISLVMYISFFGLAFFMGMTDFGKKEIMMRLLKIGLVILFTNEKAWLMYNDMIVAFFKNGMDSLIGLISGIFESNMDKTLTTVALQAGGNSVSLDVGRKFIHSDNLIMDLISKPNISRIFGLFWIKSKGFNFFALIYIPAILLLIIYFLYMVLDIALKYLINVLKICIGLALGPVFILFSLFEKTKDMFNNWVAFVASRSLEIVILFTMFHPFLIMIEHNFKAMLSFEVCSSDIFVGNGLWSHSVWKSDVDRGIFDWFEYFLNIAALIFITKSVCDKAGYISGQLISIGGVANADAGSERGRGEGGFNMATSIAKGTFGLAKTALTNSKISQAGKFAGRLMINNLTKIARSEAIGGSINNMVNSAFKAVGIRNRGLRSFMRDREVDNAYNFAVDEANRSGLEGKERDHYIRRATKSRIDAFKNENKNRATLLGLDEENINKRLDQKLIKEPMKNFIKQQAEKLKQQGIYGKEAREKIEDGVKEWGRQNLSLSEGGAERKVAEFFKKTSVKGTLESSSEMNASEAEIYAQNLISSGRVEGAKEFMDDYIKNTLISDNEKSQQREENKREGGTIVKGFAGGVNILSKVTVKPVMLVGKYGAKAVNWYTGKETIATNNYKDYKLGFSKVNLATNKAEYLAAPVNAFIWGYNRMQNRDKSPEERKELYEKRKVNSKSVRRFFGRAENLVGDAKDSALGLVGNSSRNPGKKSRKAMRKFARMMLKPENLEKIRGTAFDSDLSKFVDKEGRTAVDKEFKPIIQDRTIAPFKEKDHVLYSATTLAGKVLLSPLYVPVNFAWKKYHFYKPGGEKEEFARLGRENQLSALRKIAKEEAEKINGKLGAQHKQNLKVDEKTRVAKTEEEQKAALTRLEKSREQRESIENVALMMKKMEKTAKEQEKAQVKAFKDEEIRNKSRGERFKIFLGINKADAEEALAKTDQKQRLEDKKGEETVFERLSKIEKSRKTEGGLFSKLIGSSKDEAKDLKSAYMEAVNEKIDEYSKNPTAGNLEKLKDLRGALFVDMDTIGKNKNTDLKDIFTKVIETSPPIGAPVVNASSNSDSIEKGPKHEKQQELLKKVYEGEKKIAEAEALDRNSNSPPAQGGGQQAPTPPAGTPPAPPPADQA